MKRMLLLCCVALTSVVSGCQDEKGPVEAPPALRRPNVEDQNRALLRAFAQPAMRKLFDQDDEPSLLVPEDAQDVPLPENMKGIQWFLDADRQFVLTAAMFPRDWSEADLKVTFSGFQLGTRKGFEKEMKGIGVRQLRLVREKQLRESHLGGRVYSRQFDFSYAGRDLTVCTICFRRGRFFYSTILRMPRRDPLSAEASMQKILHMVFPPRSQEASVR